MIAIKTLWALTNNQQILPTVEIKMALFWDVAPSNLADTNRRFRETYLSPLKRQSIFTRLHACSSP